MSSKIGDSRPIYRVDTTSLRDRHTFDTGDNYELDHVIRKITFYEWYKTISTSFTYGGPNATLHGTWLSKADYMQPT